MSDADTEQGRAGVRLQVYMARCGVGSRRRCEQIIESGAVAVNGRSVTKLGTRVYPGDVVTWRGRRLVPVRRKVYVALNKPPRVLCANHDASGRPLAIDLLKGAVESRLFHVGRLDYLSTGLILFTNDGEFAHIVTHPSSGIRKEYLVDTVQPLPLQQLERCRTGLVISGERYRLVDYRLLEPRRALFVLEEGKNREIRRILEALGVQARRVHRVRIGPVTVKGLAPGQFRFLSRREVAWFLRRGRETSSEPDA